MLTIVLCFIFFFIPTNWFQLITFVSLIIGPKIQTSRLEDKWILTKIKDKTGLKLKDITLFHDKKPYGMMAGLYPFPKLILSSELYKIFNKDELEWVILHEAGHCVLWHNFIAFFIEALFFFFGLIMIINFKLNFLLTIILSVLLSILSVQSIRKLVEYEADKYSISKVTNPKGVITAQAKFKNYYQNSLFNSERSIIRKLFHWNISPSERIRMAKTRMSKFSK